MVLDKLLNNLFAIDLLNLSKINKASSRLSKLINLEIISAGIFSGFHFIGDFGDFFSFNTFMIRFFAGILLGVIYFSRGFGITAWAHSIYDLIILTKITVD